MKTVPGGSRRQVLGGEAGTAVDGGQRRIIASQPAQLSLDRAGGLNLQVVVERGDDVQPASRNAFAAETGIQLGEDEFVESGRQAERRRTRLELERRLRYLLRLRIRRNPCSTISSNNCAWLASASCGEFEGVEGGRAGDRRQGDGLGRVELVHRRVKVKAGGGVRAKGEVTEIGAVEVPLEELVAAELGAELRSQQPLAQVAARGRRLVPQQQVGGQPAGEVGLRSDSRIH